LNPASNYIVVKVENHLFLKLFPVRVILNDKDVFTVKGKKGVYAPVDSNIVKVTMNNGYHFAKPLQLQFTKNKIIGLRVETYLSDGRLLGILILTIVLFLASFVENSVILRVIANFPILALIGYSIWKKDKVLLISSLHDKSYAEKFYDEYDNIL
jgi:hypothetical protein